MFSVNRSLLAVSVAFSLWGCAAYTKVEVAEFSRAGVSGSTVRQLADGAPLGPEQIIELHRSQVPTQTIVRHLQRFGVNTLIMGHEARDLRRAGVEPIVIDAALLASEEFEDEHRNVRADVDAEFSVYDPWISHDDPFWQ
jgi:hypothetical protein